MAATPASQLVQCPNCQRTVPYTHLNPHLDRCLLSADAQGADGKAEDAVSVLPEGRASATVDEKAQAGSGDVHLHTPLRTGAHAFFSPASNSKGSNVPRLEEQNGRQTLTRPAPDLANGSPGPLKRVKLEGDEHRGSEAATRIAAMSQFPPQDNPSHLQQASHPLRASVGKARSRVDDAKPFAERMRPQTLDDYVGQRDVIDGPLKMLLKQGRIPSMILWGPPGTGKTTLARLLAKSTPRRCVSTKASGSTGSNTDHLPPAHRFVEISATTAGTADVKKIMDEALNRLQLTGQRTLLFIDEIQRFSRAQQDVFLPAVESGRIVLVAATTENPSFRLQGALLSRMRVFVLTKLSVDDCCIVLNKAIERVKVEEGEYDDGLEGERGAKGSTSLAHIDEELVRWIANVADGDARTALGALELAFSTVDPGLSSAENVDKLKKALSRTALQYDRTGDGHYDTISALHKSIRGSDADAALYWLARMVCSGDDPLFIARRLIVAASEDIDTLEALQMATATYHACQVVGLPECGENLAQCVVYLAERPKSTRSYRAWKKVKASVENEYNHPVPLHIRNAPTKLMTDLGYGKEYRYEPRFAHPVFQEFLPEQIKGTRFLSPPPRSPSPAASPTDDDTGAAVAQTGTANEAEASANSRPSRSPNPQDFDTTAAAGAVPPSAANTRAPTAFQSRMPKEAGIGPGSCQRQFEIGARAVDLDLLDEWEREKNGGRPWKGRKKLERILAELQEDIGEVQRRT